MDKKSLSVVIPVFNEESSVEAVIQGHTDVLCSLEHELHDWEIVCLDDASTDRTWHSLSSISQNHKRLRILKNQKNMGIQASFTRLFKEARGSHIYLTGGDGQWPAENLRTLFAAMKKDNFDLVIGVRKNRSRVYGAWRLLLSFGFNWLPRIFFGTKTQDANSIKIGRKEIFNLELSSKSFFAEIERIIVAKRNGFKVGFEPIEFLPRRNGKAHGAQWKNIRDTVSDFFQFLARNLVSGR